MKSPTIPKGTNPEFLQVPLDQLLLDPSNPRLKNSGETVTQIELAKQIALHFDALSLARLIAHNGFYKTGALLVYPTKGSKYIVAEGNRRLTALLGLANEEFRTNFNSPGDWNKLAILAVSKLPQTIPVYVFSGPSELRPIIAGEHLNRKLPWEPYQKSREIVNLIDVEGYTFEDISEFSGLSKSSIRASYRDFKLTKVLDKAGFDENQFTSDFSRVGEITKIKSLREFGGIPDDGEIDAGRIQMDSEKTDELLELFTWVFGEENLTPDTRQIRDLGKIVTDAESLAHLRNTLDLEESLEIFKTATEDNLDTIVKILNRALDQIERLSSKIAFNIEEPEVQSAIERASKLVKEMKKY